MSSVISFSIVTLSLCGCSLSSIPPTLLCFGVCGVIAWVDEVFHLPVAADWARLATDLVVVVVAAAAAAAAVTVKWLQDPFCPPCCPVLTRR